MHSASSSAGPVAYILIENDARKIWKSYYKKNKYIYIQYTIVIMGHTAETSLSRLVYQQTQQAHNVKSNHHSGIPPTQNEEVYESSD